MNRYAIIGIMSGTSLDGIDIAYCEFNENKGTWQFDILAADCISYTKEWHKKLKNADQLNGLELTKLNAEYGIFIGKLVNEFINKHHVSPDYIASHGHTVFHQPQEKISLQIGHGAAIAAITKLPVICDFRSLDVFLGGQGAPLVPIGDQLLFSQYTYCLNIGGIANVSYWENEKRNAYDICGANMVLNSLANELKLPYDNQGLIARNGAINEVLLGKLNAISYYSQKGPKSMGKEWVSNEILPLINSSAISVESKLATYTEHIAFQIAAKCLKKGTLFITGGGAYNAFLIDRIKKYSFNEIIIPEKLIVDYKEALIFAFLGVLRIKSEINCLESVTGAPSHVGGSIYNPIPHN